jgi:hypothetical protein
MHHATAIADPTQLNVGIRIELNVFLFLRPQKEIFPNDRTHVYIL